MAVYGVGAVYWDVAESSPRPSIVFETTASAIEFKEWLVEFSGCCLDQNGAQVTVPEGVGCDQQSLIGWVEDWEMLREG